jgi:carboxylate-amine ligase
MPRTRRSWAEWARSRALTLGLEEEVMLVEPGAWTLHQDSDGVIAALDEGLRSHAGAETHASTLELTTGVHRDVAGAVAELAALRARLAARLEGMGLRAAAAGLHPVTTWRDTELSEGPRYRALRASLHGLSRREPTFALHVHVAVPEPEEAVTVMNGLRARLPLLLALSANSPFWQGRDSGMASMRVPLFQAFPRSGPPRRFASYGDWVEAVAALVAPGAIADPTFLWWVVRLQPRFGTVEVRVMDAQTGMGDTAALVALIQCLAAALRAGEPVPGDDDPSAEVLAENRFLATRDGTRTELIAGGRMTPLRAQLEEVVRRCEPHARELGCAAGLAAVAGLAELSGADRQRALRAAEGADLPAVVAGLAEAFTASGGAPVGSARRPGRGPRTRGGAGSRRR